jgi:hypothetical protein
MPTLRGQRDTCMWFAYLRLFACREIVLPLRSCSCLTDLLPLCYTRRMHNPFRQPYSKACYTVNTR